MRMGYASACLRISAQTEQIPNKPYRQNQYHIKRYLNINSSRQLAADTSQEHSANNRNIHTYTQTTHKTPDTKRRNPTKESSTNILYNIHNNHHAQTN